MVERRRKPLILCSTKTAINSVLKSSNSSINENEFPNFNLPVGILRFSNKFPSFDHSALIALSTSLLKTLSITSGSPVLVKNAEMNTQRVAVAIALDPPSSDTTTLDIDHSPPASSRIMLVFPSCDFPLNGPLLNGEIAYLSPLLAFNLNLHVSCLKSIIHNGQDALSSYFKPQCQVGDEDAAKSIEDSVINIELKPLAQPPRFASLLRVAFVKIPECGILDSIKPISEVESKERQDMIDLALQKYFEVDRYLSSGDVFGISISWNCNSTICIPCNQKTQKNENIICFKVIAMEPSDEPVLRVNKTLTALVLVGSSPSALPPDLLTTGPEGPVPLQRDTVKILASILAPTLCPSALSSKFRVSVLLYGLEGCGKRTVVRYVARRLGLHVVEYNCHDLMGSDRTSVALAQAFKAAQRYSPTILLLRHFEVFQDSQSPEVSQNDQRGNTSEVASVIRRFTEPVGEHGDSNSLVKSNGEFVEKNSEKTSGHQVLLIAAADSSEGLPSSIRRCFSHEIKMGPLTEEQRAEMLLHSLQNVYGLHSNTDLEGFVKEIVGQTSGFMPRDMCALIADAGANLFPGNNVEVDKDQPEESDSSLISEVTEDNNESEVSARKPGKEDLVNALERSKKRNASALGTPKVPNVKWEDVGGLEDVKKSILDTVQLPLLHKDLFASGLRKRSGVLLYGPPGTGKTLLAKAVATECSLNFLSVKGPELINMYIGESEKNVRDIFQKARSARPCVIFFDELDSLAPARGASGDSGGVMDRVVSQMLAEIDGLSDSTQDLFIIGASNRPDLIDPALLRPGRFDKLLYVGVVSDATYRERVLKALTRKFKLHEDVSLYTIATKCPPNFTGADMYALCADAWFLAAKRRVLNAEPESSNPDNDADSIVVEYDDFVQVLEELQPSLSMAELKKYELLRDQFEGTSK